MKLPFPQSHRKADPPRDCLFRAGLSNAASSSALHANVRKTAWSHIPQPACQPTAHCNISPEPKSPRQPEIFPATGDGRGSEEEHGRKKEMAAAPSQPSKSSKSLALPFTHRVKIGATFFSSSLEKHGQKSPALLYCRKHPARSCQVCWGAGALQQPLSLGCRGRCRDDLRSQRFLFSVPIWSPVNYSTA